MTLSVIPAKAGIQNLWKLLDSRLRGNDGREIVLTLFKRLKPK